MLEKYELALEEILREVEGEVGTIEITKQLSEHTNRDKLIIHMAECFNFINKGIMIINFNGELISVEVNKERLQPGSFFKNVEYSVFYGCEDRDNIIDLINVDAYPILIIGIDDIEREVLVERGL